MLFRSNLGGRTTALVRSGGQLAGPGLQEEAPSFDELVLGYLDGDAALPAEALA